MAFNAADKHQCSFIEHLLPVALEKKIGIIGMKVATRGRMLSTWTPPPLSEQPTRMATNQTGHDHDEGISDLQLLGAGQHQHCRL